MSQIIEEQDSQDDTAAEWRYNAKQRARLKACLSDIASEVTTALNDAGIVMAVFFTVPSSGPLMTFATPTDPDDATWNRVREIVIPIVCRTFGVDELVCQEAPCAAAGVTMAAADLLEDSDTASVDW
jgi:hypothetical protein